MPRQKERLEFGKPIPEDPFIGGLATLYWRYATREKHTAWMRFEQQAFELLLNDYDRGSMVLEVGSGAGNMTSLLLSLGFCEDHLHAIEPNEVLYKRYSKLHPKAVSFNASMHELRSLAISEQQLVLAHMVLNHIPDDKLYQSLLGAYYALKSGGTFMFMVPDPIEKAIKHNIDPELEGFSIKEAAPWGGTIEYHHRSEEKLFTLMSRAGFINTDVLCRPIVGKPLNQNYPPPRSISPYFLREHDMHSVFPQRLVMKGVRR